MAGRKRYQAVQTVPEQGVPLVVTVPRHSGQRSGLILALKPVLRDQAAEGPARVQEEDLQPAPLLQPRSSSIVSLSARQLRLHSRLPRPKDLLGLQGHPERVHPFSEGLHRQPGAGGHYEVHHGGGAHEHQLGNAGTLSELDLLPIWKGLRNKAVQDRRPARLDQGLRRIDPVPRAAEAKGQEGDPRLAFVRQNGQAKLLGLPRPAADHDGRRGSAPQQVAPKGSSAQAARLRLADRASLKCLR